MGTNNCCARKLDPFEEQLKLDQAQQQREHREEAESANSQAAEEFFKMSAEERIKYEAYLQHNYSKKQRDNGVSSAFENLIKERNPEGNRDSLYPMRISDKERNSRQTAQFNIVSNTLKGSPEEKPEVVRETKVKKKRGQKKASDPFNQSTELTRKLQLKSLIRDQKEEELDFQRVQRYQSNERHMKKSSNNSSNKLLSPPEQSSGKKSSDRDKPKRIQTANFGYEESPQEQNDSFEEDLQRETKVGGRIEAKIGIVQPQKLKLLKDESDDVRSSEFKDVVELFPAQPKRNQRNQITIESQPAYKLIESKKPESVFKELEEEPTSDSSGKVPPKQQKLTLELLHTFEKKTKQTTQQKIETYLESCQKFTEPDISDLISISEFSGLTI